MSLEDGKRDRDEAMGRADANADADWREEADLAILRMARSHDLFTAEDVFEAGLRRPREARAMGPAMMRAKRDRVIEPTSTFRLAKRREVHAQPLRVWRSLVRVTW